MFDFLKKKKYYCCKCLHETVILHHDWYAICSMYGHPNSRFRPLFQWEKNKFDYKNFLKAKKTRMIHPKTSEYLEFLLRMLEEKGEKETFDYLKKHKKDEY